MTVLRSLRTTSTGPVLSVVVADDGDEASLVKATASSLTAQTNPGWEMVVATKGSFVDNSHGGSAETSGPKRRRVNRIGYAGSRAYGWAEAVKRCGGRYVMILDAGTTLNPEAVEIVAAELDRHGDAPDLLYGDEDVVDASGRRGGAFYKPAFSPDRLRAQDYLGEAVLYRTELLTRIGGLNPTYGTWSRYDLSLRMAEQAEIVVHVAAILTHVEAPIGPSDSSGFLEAVQAHLDRTRFPAQAVESVTIPDCQGRRQALRARLRPALTEHPKVSVIIPTGGSSRVVRGRRLRLIDLVLSSMDSTNYTNYEVVVVFDRHSTDELQSSVAERLAGQANSLVQDHRPFNYSQACNLGAARSSGDVLVFLNDDTEIVRPDWMDRLVMFATRPQVGAVGVKLLYEDGRLQHTGVWARDGHVAHRYAGFNGDHPGVRGSLMVQQNCSAVTGACLAVERTKFEHVGGFCTALPLAFNDVDLCFKLQMAGYRSLIDGDNIVLHLESSSRNPSTHQWELDHLHHRWRPVMYFDPYDNPNNSGRDCDEFPATPPEMADARWQQRQFQRNGRTWRRSPIVVDDDGALSGVTAELVEVGTGGGR